MVMRPYPAGAGQVSINDWAVGRHDWKSTNRMVAGSSGARASVISGNQTNRNGDIHPPSLVGRGSTGAMAARDASVEKGIKRTGAPRLGSGDIPRKPNGRHSERQSGSEEIKQAGSW